MLKCVNSLMAASPCCCTLVEVLDISWCDLINAFIREEYKAAICLQQVEILVQSDPELQVKAVIYSLDIVANHGWEMVG
jgi:hypothetical protein